MKRYNLQYRLNNFAARIIRVAESLPDSKTGKNIQGQLQRIGTFPASNYEEAQGVESRLDFIHKLKVGLRELRKTKDWLMVIIKKELIKSKSIILPVLSDNEELISILYSYIDTAKKIFNLTDN
jgi:four helix bundle protein